MEGDVKMQINKEHECEVFNNKNLKMISTPDIYKAAKQENKTIIESLKQDSETEKYLQALFDTKDNIDKIIKVLKKFDKNRELRLWTPSQSSRESKQVRSVDLGFYDFGWFVVVGDGWFGYYIGLSRGVIANSAKQTKFFSNKAIFDIEEETILIPMKKKLLKDIEKKQSSNGKVKINWNLKVKLK